MSIWARYPDLSDDELRTLVAVTAEELLASESGGEEFSTELLGLSPLSASRQLMPLLGETEAAVTVEQIQQALEDDDLSARLTLKILSEIKTYPELADRIAARYEERSRKMAVPELMLLAGALTILAIKLKEIRWSSTEKKISFYESSTTIKDFATGLIKSLKPL